MSTSQDINRLFRQAQQEGLLSAAATQALVAIDSGAHLAAVFSLNVDDVPFSEVVLLKLKIDDSGSIAHAGMEQTMRDGHNAILDAVLDARQRDNVFVSTELLNGDQPLGHPAGLPTGVADGGPGQPGQRLRVRGTVGPDPGETRCG